MKQILIFGLIPGVIWIVVMILVANAMYTNPDLETNDYLGFALMLVVFSLIFFGIRDYRNKKLGGFISFWKAVKTGVLMALVATAAYVGIWLFYYYLFAPDFLDVFSEFVLNATPPSELDATTKYLDNIRKWYNNPFGVALITALEVLPIGLIVTLISAVILKKKKSQTDEA
jgi:hypothetical protein